MNGPSNIHSSWRDVRRRAPSDDAYFQDMAHFRATSRPVTACRTSGCWCSPQTATALRAAHGAEDHRADGAEWGAVNEVLKAQLLDRAGDRALPAARFSPIVPGITRQCSCRSSSAPPSNDPATADHGAVGMTQFTPSAAACGRSTGRGTTPTRGRSDAGFSPTPARARRRLVGVPVERRQRASRARRRARPLRHDASARCAVELCSRPSQRPMVAMSRCSVSLYSAIATGLTSIHARSSRAMRSDLPQHVIRLVLDHGDDRVRVGTRAVEHERGSGSRRSSRPCTPARRRSRVGDRHAAATAHVDRGEELRRREAGREDQRVDPAFASVARDHGVRGDAL